MIAPTRGLINKGENPMENQQPNGGQAVEEDVNPGIDLDSIDPESATPEQVEQTIKFAKVALGQKNHWKEKALKAQTPTNPSPEAPHPPKDPPATDQTAEKEKEERLARLELAEDKRQFADRHGYSARETDIIFAQAKGMNIPPDQAKDDEFVKSGIEALRKQKRVSDSIPGPSRKSPKVDGKSFEDMTPEEQKKNWAKVTGAA